MPFEFATAGRIVFGEGALRDVPQAVSSLGHRCLMVTGASPGRTATLLAELPSAVRFAVAGEPSVDTIRSGVEFAQALFALE